MRSVHGPFQLPIPELATTFGIQLLGLVFALLLDLLYMHFEAGVQNLHLTPSTLIIS